MPAAVRRPVLSQSYPNYMPPMAPVLDTAPAKKKSKLVPMVINEGTSMAYTVMYDPENNKVVSDDSALSNMMTSNIDTERETLKAANEQYRQNTVVDPYQEAEQKMKVANDKFNLAQQYELGSSPYLEEYTDASNEAKAILENDVEPNAIDGVLNASNTYRQAPHALDVFEQDGLDRRVEAEEYLGKDMMAAVGEFNATDSAVLPAQGEMPTGARKDPYMPIPSTKEGYHRMPDGTLMADSEMQSPDGVLGNNFEPKPEPKAVLDTTSSNDRKGSAVSANARGSAMPFGKINRNEALMRIGGAIIGGSDQGFAGSARAATQEFGNIQDANRQAETDAFNKAEATRLAEERIAALKAKADAKNAKTVDPESLRYGQAALASINSIQSSLDNDTSENIFDSMNIFDNATGVFGNLLKSVPNTPAHSVMLNIETIEAAVAFDRLQAMRNASKTGGALGQVSNIELRLLSSSLGNLKQSNSKEEFQRNLNQVKKVYNEIVHGKDYQDPSDVKKPTTNNDALYNEADAIIG